MKYKISIMDGLHRHVLSEIHSRCFVEPWTKDAFASLIAMPGIFGFFASSKEDENIAPIGFALFRLAADECEIITIGVIPEFRGTGAGSSLLQAGTIEASNLGSRRMLLEVACDNEPALALYKSKNFRNVGLRENYYRVDNGVYTDAIIMGLCLKTSKI